MNFVALYDPEFAGSNEPSSAKPYIESTEAASCEQSEPASTEGKLARSDIEYVLRTLVESGFLEPQSLSQAATSPQLREELNALQPNIGEQLKKITNEYGSSAEKIFSLLTLKDRIPAAMRNEAEEIAACAIKAMWQEYARWDEADPIDTLRSLEDFLPAQARHSILEELRTSAFSTTLDAGWRLARLALALNNPGEALKEAETRFLAAEPGRIKDKAMAALVAASTRSRIPYLLSEYQRLADDEDRARLRFSVAPHLGTGALLDDISKQDSKQRLKSFAMMIQELVPVIDEFQLRSFVQAATELVADWWVIEALSDVLLRVESVEATLRILNVARQIGRADLKSRLVNRVVDRLAELGSMDIAVSTSLEGELRSERCAGLADTAESLAAKGRFREAALIAACIDDREERGRAQAFIALHEAGYGNLQQARQNSDLVDSEKWRSWINSRLGTLDEKANTESGRAPRHSPRVLPKFDDLESLTTLLSDTSNHNALMSVAAFISAANPHPDLSLFWKSEAGRKFFQSIGGILRPELWKVLRKLVPVLARYGATEDLVALEISTREAVLGGLKVPFSAFNILPGS